MHAQAPRAEATDWRQIALLYAELGARAADARSSTLNRAVAIAMADGPAAGLALVDALAAGGALDDYHLLHAARADLLRREGRRRRGGRRVRARAGAGDERAPSAASSPARLAECAELTRTRTV